MPALASVTRPAGPQDPGWWSLIERPESSSSTPKNGQYGRTPRQQTDLLPSVSSKITEGPRTLSSVPELTRSPSPVSLLNGRGRTLAAAGLPTDSQPFSLTRTNGITVGFQHLGIP